MKKIICLFLITVLLIPFGTVALAVHAGAADAFMAEDESSNTAFAADAAESFDGASISGKVNASFSFSGDGQVILLQNDVIVKEVDILADGTYLLNKLPAGTYDLRVIVPGWTYYNLYDINLYENQDITVVENTIIAGDANADQKVDVQDVAAVLGALGEHKVAANEACDVNHDGCIDIGDITFILAGENYAEKAYSSYFINNGYTETY